MNFNILGIGPWQIIIVLLVMLIVAGPKRMVLWAYQAGRYVAMFRKMFDETMSAFQKEMQESGIDLTKDTSVIAVSSDDTFVSVQIEEKQTLGGSHKVLLMFSSKDMQLKQWTITDPQGFDTTVALYNLDPTKKLDPGMFKINYERKEIIQ